MRVFYCIKFYLLSPRNHSFSTFVKFFERLTFLTPPPEYAHVRARIGVGNVTYAFVSGGKKFKFFGKFCERTK